MAFTINAGLAKLIESLGIATDNALAAANALAAKYPDAAQFEQQFADWLKNNMTQQLDPAKLTATLLGIAADIRSHGFVADPKAFGGAV